MKGHYGWRGGEDFIKKNASLLKMVSHARERREDQIDKLKYPIIANLLLRMAETSGFMRKNKSQEREKASEILQTLLMIQDVNAHPVMAMVKLCKNKFFV